MSIDPRLMQDVELAEGRKLEPYQDTLGNWTIGYGHLLPGGPCAPIDGAQARSFLIADLSEAAALAQGTEEWPVLDTAARQNAVIEIVFNMGLGRWRGFVQCREAIQDRDWNDAATQLLDSRWANEVGPTRSQRLASYLRSGQYPEST